MAKCLNQSSLFAEAIFFTAFCYSRIHLPVLFKRDNRSSTFRQSMSMKAHTSLICFVSRHQTVCRLQSGVTDVHGVSVFILRDQKLHFSQHTLVRNVDLEPLSSNLINHNVLYSTGPSRNLKNFGKNFREPENPLEEIGSLLYTQA